MKHSYFPNFIMLKSTNDTHLDNITRTTYTFNYIFRFLTEVAPYPDEFHKPY